MTTPHISQPASPARKRIIICCDGTWQSAVSGEKNIPSNVTRLCRLLARAGKDEHGEVWEQVVYYDSGVGTGAILALEAGRQGGSGDGLAINVVEAYNFIVLNYQPGDEIFCFGFSRGAYTARAIAGLVTDIGVIEPRDLQVFPEVYDIYKKNKTGGNFRKTEAWRHFVTGKLSAKQPPRDPNAYKGGPPPKWDIRPHGELAVMPESRKIKVIGVWDTVGSLGIPDIRGWNLSWFRSSHQFHNVRLNSHIENAFHALALDERRGPFSPTLWYLPRSKKEDSGEKSEEPKPDPNKSEEQKQWEAAIDDEEEREHSHKPSNLLQVWFPGYHINVGGGSDDLLKNKQGDLEQLSNITFAWMVDQVSPYLAFKENGFAQSMREHDELLASIAQEDVPPTWTEWATEKALFWREAPERQKRKVHRGWATGPMVDSYSGMMVIAGEIKRKPGECIDDKGRPLSDFGETNEEIHPSVAYRQEMKDADGEAYTNAFLENWKREPCKGKKKGYQWVKKDGSKKKPIPEYKIKPGYSNMERLATEGAMEFIEKLDKANGYPTY